jgi:hypothetical protein
MTSEKLYYTLSLLVNKNNENSEITIERENFVLLYNREALRWLADYIELNNSTDNIANVGKLVVKDKELVKTSSPDNRIVYSVPGDYFIPVHGDFRSQTSCGVIYNWVFKPNDVNTALEDKMTRPSVAWERGVASISEDAINVYRDGFDVVSTTMSYYRKPREIDLVGYINLEGESSINIDPDLNDYLCNQILDRVATEIKREWPSGSEFQIAQTRERGY